MNEQQRVAALNNEAVCLLATCEDEKALLRLRDALFTLKSLVNSNTDPSEDSGVAPQNNETAELDNMMAANSSRPACAPLTVSQSYDQTTACSAEFRIPPAVSLPAFQHDSQGFIFSKPLVFSGMQSPMAFQMSLHLYGAVIIFNIALAHHRIGKLTGWQSYLEKAVLFYDSCMELLAKGERRVGHASLLKLAALNNASELRFELGQHLIARHGFDLLLDLFAGGTDAVENLSKDDSDGLILNVLLLRNGAAAAAA